MSFRVQKKKGIILAIDVGKNSLQQHSDGKTYFEKSIICASMILKKKIFNGNNDHLGLILFGSSLTINHLSPQERCYANIEIVSDLDLPSWDLIKRVNNLSPTKITHSDWISTFVLASDVLKNKNKYENFTSSQVIMFSNLSTDISFENVDIIARCLRQENIRLTIIGNNCEVIPLNDALGVFVKRTKAIAVNYKLVIPKLSYYNQKEVIKNQWDACLSFINVFIVKVFGYKQIDVTTIKSKWLFNKNYDIQNNSSDEDEQMENHESRLNPAPDGNLNNKNPRCLHVLGFAKTTNTQRSFLMEGGSYIFKPHKRDVNKFNAIFQYMVEREEVLIVRKMDLYINLVNMAVLFPQKEDNEKFFVFVNLPFIENEQFYKIPSVGEVLQFNLANDNFPINDLRDEFVMPELKYNHRLQYAYECIVQKLIPEKLLPRRIPAPFPKSITENKIPPLKEFIKTSSPQQQISENSIEDNIVETKNKTLLVEDNNSTEFIKTFSPQQEISENSIEDNIVETKNKTLLVKDKNSTEFIHDQSLNVSKECVISELNPIEDFNKLLENGFDSAIGGIGLISNQEIEASNISQESSEEFVQLPEDLDNDFIIDDDNPLKKCL